MSASLARCAIQIAATRGLSWLIGYRLRYQDKSWHPCPPRHKFFSAHISQPSESFIFFDMTADLNKLFKEVLTLTESIYEFLNYILGSIFSLMI